jgi:Trk-type K+ transport system membrane component
MKSVNKWIVIIGIIIVGNLSYMIYRSYNIDINFKIIKIGDNESRVVTLLGKPGKVVFLGEKKFWSSYVKGSVKEFHYEPNILPEIWVIGFDVNNNVVYRYHNLM